MRRLLSLLLLSLVFTGTAHADLTQFISRRLVSPNSSLAGQGNILGTSTLVSDITDTPLYVVSSSATIPQVSIEQATTDAVGSELRFYKTRKTDNTADTIVASGDKITSLLFKGANGATFDNAAQIIVTIDGTPGASADMPGAIDFQVSPDGSATTASALKLSNTKFATFGGGASLSTATALGSSLVVGGATLNTDLTDGAWTGTFPAETVIADGRSPIMQLVTYDGGAGYQAYAAGVVINKTRSTSVTGDANTIVVSGDQVGQLRFRAADGASYVDAAQILVTVDGTPGSTDMPGAIDFLVSPDGSATLASALKISNTKAAAFTGTVTSSRTTDLGWSFVDQTDNQACNTGCTSACAFGIANATGTAVTALVSCSDTTADSCICAGAS